MLRQFMLRQLIAVPALAITLSCSASVAFAGQAGQVIFVVGQVQLAGHPAALDLAVQEGDELSTGADGYIYVKTIDNGFLILRPNSKARIVAYHVDQQNPANTRVKLELDSGVARSISGQAVKQARQNFRFNTPVAAIGVRGTDFTVFTDAQTSRVAVMSGGVIVSGFAGACGPEGGGPCEGSASRELFAGQTGILLQVQRGQRIPQLLHNPALVPDHVAPPRADEPVGKVSGAAALPSTEVNLDAQKNDNLPKLAVSAPAPAPAPAPVPAPNLPVVVVPPPSPLPVKVIAKSPPEVLWGRFQAIAGVAGPDPQFLGKLDGGTYAPAMIVGSHAIARLKDATFVLPHEGQVSFALTASDVLMQKTGQTAVAASVESPHLDINFGSRTFSTSLTAVTPDQRVPVAAKGDVTLTGSLVSNSLSDSLVRGYLGGAGAGEAGYIFKNTSAPGVTVTGATAWSR